MNRFLGPIADQPSLATLLHLANQAASHSLIRKDEFYALKERLLKQHGALVGYDLQHIVKECWSCEGTGIFGRSSPCYKCLGTGKYSEFWVRLERWEWGGYIFHRPVERYHRPPDGEPVTIEGYIRHDAKEHYLLVHEARLWLFVFCGEWNLLWMHLRGSCFMRPRFWPLLNLQRLAMNLREFFRLNRCGDCGHRWKSWDNCIHMICPRCLRLRDAEWRRNRERPDDIPF